jgi:hypothetical protein
MSSEPTESPESAGVINPLGGTYSFSPESRGAFRQPKIVTVRNIEIARKLAISETLNPLEQMRQRIEAAVMLPTELRRRHGVTDEEMRKAKEIYRLVIAFQNAEERFVMGFRALTFPFPQRIEDEISLGFSEWLGLEIVDDILSDKNWAGLPPETFSRLKTRFEADAGLWVLALSAKVADSLNLQEFNEASQGGVLAPLRRSP